MLKHRRDDWQDVGVQHSALAEHVRKILQVESPVEVDLGHIEPEKDAQAHGPEGRNIPPMSQTMGHDGKPARLICEFGGVVGTMSNQDSGNDLAAVDDNLWIFFGKQIKKPLMQCQVSNVILEVCCGLVTHLVRHCTRKLVDVSIASLLTQKPGIQLQYLDPDLFLRQGLQA